MTPSPRKRKSLIDWNDLRQRLARTSQAIEGTLIPSPDRAQELLDERARALARPSRVEGPTGKQLEILTFGLASERYGIETPYVREVVRLTDLTPVPGAPEFAPGVTNLRGEILAVIDLRKLFGIPTKGLTDLTRLLVLGLERAEFGLLADQAEEVMLLSAGEIREPPASVAGIGREYLRGITNAALIVLDASVLLRDKRLFVDQRNGTRHART